jgi:uncharacterized glyoxalase superfamily protein PhnB
MSVKPVPDGYHTATPYLNVKGGSDAIAFYVKALGAVERFRMPGPGGAVMHAELQVGDSVVMLCDENPQMGCLSPQTVGGTGSSVFLYVNDVDAAFKAFTEAGGTVLMPPTDMFWGDRFCKGKDPFGHEWAMATHVEDVSPEELEKRSAAAAADCQG